MRHGETVRYAADVRHAIRNTGKLRAVALLVVHSLLGAIAPDGAVARRAGRILAAFYIPSMPPALLERHGIELERVAAVTELKIRTGCSLGGLSSAISRTEPRVIAVAKAVSVSRLAI